MESPLLAVEAITLPYKSEKTRILCRTLVLGTLFIATLIVVAAAVSFGIIYSSDITLTFDDDDSFAGRITLPNLMNHLEQFQTIAENNNNSRAVELGYNASANYVQEQLINAGYTPSIFNFSFNRNVVTGAPQLGILEPETNKMNFTEGINFNILRYSANSTVVGPVVFVGKGCNNTFYPPLNASTIVLAELNDECSVQTQVDAATNATASGMLIYNSAPGGGAFTRPRPDNLLSIPLFSVTNELGLELKDLSTNNLIMRMVSQTAHTTESSFNVLAEYVVDPKAMYIVLGSHLDSVAAGPGINDNGSGSSINLEIAIQWMEYQNSNGNTRPIQNIRFAWWSAEELGLWGSTSYVQNLTTQEKQQIACNLNIDMGGSPNYFRGIYDGKSEDPLIRPGSVQLAKMFQQYFDSKNLAWNDTAFTGRSDYGPFIENGIPAGGLFTGAEVIKDLEMRTKFGGYGNAAFDPCYHLACDTVENINQLVLIDNGRATASVLYDLAYTQNITSLLSLSY